MRATLLALAVLLPAVSHAASDRSVDRWGVEEGLRNNVLTSIIQTRDGYLWIGSWAGIVRFDGIRFTHVADDLPNVHARVLVEDPDGSIWVGTSGGGVFRWRPGRIDSYDVAHGLAGDDVNAMIQDPQGRIWVGTEAGLSAIAGGRIATWRREQGLPDNVVTGLSSGSGGRVWVTTMRGVCLLEAMRLQCRETRSPMGAPSAALERGDGRLFVGARLTGLYEMREEALVPACDGCLAGRDITALAAARNGDIWIGFGWGGGVARLRADGTVSHYTAADGLPSLPVISVYEDPEGSLWIATDNGGLARLRPKRVTTYSMADGLPAKVVTSIVQDAAGRIWVGSRCGPVTEFRHGRFEPRFVEFTKEACTHAVLPARDGSLWIGTDGRGLFRWDGRRMQNFSRAEGLSDTTVGALFEDRDGVLWIGTDRGGVHRFVDGTLSRAYDARDGVATGYLQSLGQDREGRVWIGSNANGMTVYQNGVFRRLGPAERPPAQNIAALFRDSHGDFWVGTAANGLFRYRNGRYEPFGKDQGLGDSLVALMSEDREGNLWVSTTRGISRLERTRIDAVAEGRARSLDPIILDRTDGLVMLEGSGGGFDPSGLRAQDGRLWFSTIDGIVVVDPSSFAVNRIPPKVLIEGATLADRPVAVAAGEAIQVAAGTSSIELPYTAFSLLVPEKVRFRYRLVGIDDAWEDAGGRRVAYFSRLPPGTYTFEVMAANNDGVWSSAPAAVTLVVAPFLWERGSVRAAALGLLLAATAMAVRFVTLRRARRRVAELEREQALTRERSRIARDLHDDLGSRLSHIALLADAADGHAGGERISRAARDAVHTMDELVWAVNARNDTVESFANYAAQFAEEHLQAAGLRCRLRMPSDPDARELSADTRRHVYLAFKEAVTNAVKHAQASEVRIAVAIDNGILVVAVADDGRGLSPEQMDPTGNGLRNMRERMDAAGGTIDIDSAPGRGTRVVFRTPIQ